MVLAYLISACRQTCSPDTPEENILTHVFQMPPSDTFASVCNDNRRSRLLRLVVE